ncbi:MAG: hypothetical protein RIR00_607 [Pseudomonadota bacterium]|jgi:iron complex transport system ATP-binding protein
MTALLSARQLTVRIGQKLVCSELDLELEAGQRLAILGRNGAGKSTLLSTLAGLRPPESGALLLQGQAYADLGARAAACLRGWLGQHRGDPFAASVLETALAGRHPHLGRWQWENRDDLAHAKAALEEVGLAGLAEREVQTLSGGERQRLAIATLLAQAPRLYLLDEPLSHLDLNHQVAMLELFSRRSRQQGVALVMVLHEPAQAWRYADRVLLVHGDGRCEQGSRLEMLSAERLSALYAHPLQVLDHDGQRCFIPR